MVCETVVAGCQTDCITLLFQSIPARFRLPHNKPPYHVSQPAVVTVDELYPLVIWKCSDRPELGTNVIVGTLGSSRILGWFEDEEGKFVDKCEDCTVTMTDRCSECFYSKLFT